MINGQFCIKLIHCGNVNIANPKDSEQKNIFFMPMGLFPMADKLKKNGFDVEIIHMDLEAEKSIQEILDFDTVDAVGFDDHWVNESLVVLDTAALIKRINPGIFVFLGGYTASLFAEEIVSGFSQVDAVIRGDGEIPIVELAVSLHKEKSKNRSIVKNPGPETLKDVQNLVWKTSAGSVIVNRFSYTGTAEEMEKLDFAAVDLLRNWENYRLSSFFYTHFEPIGRFPMFLLETARGCRYACAYCGGNSLAQSKISRRDKMVFRSVDSAIRTIKKAVSFGFETFYTCNEWEESDEWYIQLLRRVKEEKLEINYGYGCWRLPSQALVDALSECCKQVVIELSPETADYEIRKKNKDYRLAYTNQEMEECLDYISTKENIKVQVFFGYYLTSDTEETILNTVVYILRLLIKYPHLLEIEYANFSTDPGSLFFFFPEKYGMDMNVRNFRDYVRHLKENYVQKQGQQADMTLFKPENISHEDNVEIHRKIRLLNYLFDSYRKSVSYILTTWGTPDIIINFLKEKHMILTAANTFPVDEVKKMLVAHCMKNKQLDELLLALINLECEKVKSGHRILKPTTQLYLDFDREEAGQGNDDEGSMIDYIKSKLEGNRKEEDMDIEFDV